MAYLPHVLQRCPCPCVCVCVCVYVCVYVCTCVCVCVRPPTTTTTPLPAAGSTGRVARRTEDGQRGRGQGVTLQCPLPPVFTINPSELHFPLFSHGRSLNKFRKGKYKAG